jgi:hypothetical protein
MSHPTRGWLELVDSAEQLVVEFWRWDGLKTWAFGG